MSLLQNFPERLEQFIKTAQKKELQKIQLKKNNN